MHLVPIIPQFLESGKFGLPIPAGLIGLQVKGIIPQQTISIVDVKWHGSTAVELFYKRADGQPGTQLLYRSDEPNLEIAQTRRAWSFSADGDLFRLVAEAYRLARNRISM